MNITTLQKGDILFFSKGHDVYHTGAVYKGNIDPTKIEIIHMDKRTQRLAKLKNDIFLGAVNKTHEVYVFRPNNYEIGEKALDTLNNWSKYYVKYDMTLIPICGYFANDIMGKEVYKKTESLTRKNLLDGVHENEMNKLFHGFQDLYNKNKSRILKYAVRRKYRPLHENSEHGFLCVTPLLLSYQIGCIQEYVRPLKDDGSEWNSDKDIDPSFLNVPIENVNYDKIPPGLRIDAKFCPVQVLYRSLVNDKQNFSFKGKLFMNQNN